MAVKVISFGQLAEITGKDFLAEIVDTDGLATWLRDRYNMPGNIKYLVAVNKKLINGNTLLNADDSVALLPPYSGG